jgi:hypothetical protein
VRLPLAVVVGGGFRLLRKLEARGPSQSTPKYLSRYLGKCLDEWLDKERLMQNRFVRPIVRLRERERERGRERYQGRILDSNSDSSVSTVYWPA